MLEIEGRYKSMSKHERIRVEQWVSLKYPLILYTESSAMSSDLKPPMEKE